MGAMSEDQRSQKDAEDENDEEDPERDHEQNLRDRLRTRSDAGEAEPATTETMKKTTAHFSVKAPCW